MKIIPVTDPIILSFPLPIYSSIRMADAGIDDAHQFSIYVGMDKEQVEKLRKLSLDQSDTDLQQNTSDFKRFGQGSFEEWYAKGRIIFTLIDEKTKSLAALAWFGQKALGVKSAKHLSEKEEKESRKISSENWHTVAYRSYLPFRGKGLMKGFVLAVMDFYSKQYPGIKIWAGINSKNEASQKLAESLGFIPLEEASDRANHWLVMVKTNENFRDGLKQ